MATMKNTGMLWIGQIPVDWELGKVKYAFNRKKEKSTAKDPIVLSLARAGVRIRDISTNEGQLAASYEGYNPVEPNDLLLNPMDLVSGANCSISKVSGVISPAYINLRAKTGFEPRYYDYYFKTQYWNMGFFVHGKGVSFENRWTLNDATLKDYYIPMPSLSEQQAIADYLDETCSKIDEIIAESKASIDEYKELKQSVIDKAVLHGLCNGMMKDSGNDLIGKIPLSWEMRKLKYVADFNPGITTAYDAQKEVGYVPMNCVKNGYMNPLSARLSDMSTGLTGFQDGDIVIAKVTPCFENGNIAVAENLEQGVAFGSSELFVIRTHSINRRFMLYYLQNSVFKNQCISTMTGTGGLKRVSGYFVNNAYITYPPENEQQVIVNYLNESVKNMDSLIAEKESLINDLEAYKKSLIYEVVTGKRRVV